MKTYLDFINLVIQTPYLANIDEMIEKVAGERLSALLHGRFAGRTGRQDGHGRRRV